MQIKFFLIDLWNWLIYPGIPVAALIVLGILIPRIARLVVRATTNRLNEDAESTKSKLALVGALVYIVEAIAFFIIAMRALTLLGVPATSAAIPATVVSAAIGFGAQNVIGDFLSGVFIITERQFGVGDYVSFDGPSDPVEGTVTALTLRATKVRTPSGELVTVPNGSAGVITNYSQDWSRAFIEIDIPLQPGEDMVDLTDRVQTAAEDAIDDDAIRSEVTGSVSVMPAIKVVQPVAAGQPWAVTFRVTADVTPAMQWAVERTIRSALIDAFWNRLDFVMDASGDRATAPRPSSGAKAHKPEHEKPAAVTPAPQSAAQTAQPTESVAAAAKADHDEAVEAQKSADEDPDEAAREAHARAVKAMDDGPGRVETPDEDEDDEEYEGWFRRYNYDSRFKQLLTAGGRTRMSTTVLLVALVLLGGLALASSNPDEGKAGVLNPSYWQNRTADDDEEVENVEGGEPQSGDQGQVTDDSTVDDQQQVDQQQNSNSDQQVDDSNGNTQQQNTQSGTQSGTQQGNQQNTQQDSGDAGTAGTQQNSGSGNTGDTGAGTEE